MNKLEATDPLYGGPRPFEKTLFNNRELQALLTYQINLGLCRAACVIDEFRTDSKTFRSRRYQIDGQMVNPDQDLSPETARVARQIAENFIIIGINPHMPSVGLTVAETEEGKIVYTASATRLQLYKNAQDFRELTENEVDTYASEIKTNVAREKIAELTKITDEARRVGGFAPFMGFEAPGEKPLSKAATVPREFSLQRNPFKDVEGAVNKLARNREILIQIAQGKPCSEIPELDGEVISRDEALIGLLELQKESAFAGLEIADQMKAFLAEYGGKDDIKIADDLRRESMDSIIRLVKIAYPAKNK